PLAADQRSVAAHAPSRMGSPGDAPPASTPPPKRVSEPTRAPQASALRLQSIATLDMEQLAAFTHDCRACKLGAVRHQAVFGAGHPRAHVMVIGEAPGAEEDRLGEPFVGAAGKLLDNMLRAAGLARNGADEAQAVFIANVIKCRPPGNRNPETDEIAQCEPILARQIALVRPRLLLALGRFAAQTLTGSPDPIGRLRQRLFHYRDIPVVVSYHPAYLLRTPLDKAKAWADLCFAQEQLAVALATNSAAAS
ncbi:MAG: uracil-DNA glycosylase, partial [Betaproteobacteria bacterium]|nr:uracil-DNA glycosylase [Betaproteobacteria bacterium]